MTPPVRREALATASMRAARLHQQMRTSYDRPVDVFGLTQRLGLWLAAQPLDHTYGFYLREGNAAGIVLNSQHPETLQRYTCAHELGHHLLGHGSHTDNSDTVDRTSDLALQEHQAQVFAAALLMPAPLVNRTLRQLGVTGVPAAAEIYAASRDMAVSYAAALWGLAQLNKLDFDLAQALAKNGAKPAKDALRGGPAVGNPRADVWVIDDPEPLGVLRCRVGDEIHIRLPEDLGTGHVWTLDTDTEPALTHDDMAGMQLRWDGGSDLGLHHAMPTGTRPQPSGFEVLADRHLAAKQARPSVQPQGSLFDFDSFDEGDHFEDLSLPEPGTRIFVLSPDALGEHTIQLSLRPAWDNTAAPTARRRFSVTAGPRRTLPDQGFASQQNERRVQELAAA